MTAADCLSIALSAVTLLLGYIVGRHTYRSPSASKER